MPMPSCRSRQHLPAILLGLSLLGATLPGGAQAACVTAPTTQNFADAFADEGTGYAPDVVSLNVAVDSNCTASISAGISNQSSMESGDFFGWFVNTDGNPATGAPSGFTGADLAIARVPGAAQLLPWSASSAAFVDGPPIATAGLFGAAFNLDGYVPYGPRTITIAGGSSWTNPSTGSRVYDWAPEPGLAPFGIPLNLSQPAPPAPPATPTPQNEPICTVPRSKGMAVEKAKAKLRMAGCTLGAIRRERSTRIPRGRVIRLSQPTYSFVAATQPIRIIVSSGPGPRGRASRTAVEHATAPSMETMINAANAAAAKR